MNRKKLAFSFAAALTATAACGRAESLETARCAALTSVLVQDVSVQSAAMHDAGPFAITAPFRVSFPLPPFCRVEAVATPSPDSEIHFEVWLPEDRAWNGKLIAVGNGGYDSTIYYWEMAPLLRRGFAVVGGDTGHKGSGPEFGAGHPEKIRDWGDRSIHVITAAAKKIVMAFEGKPAGHSYFSGCSTGGHQALTEAQRYPADFDGIIAGAPGNNRTHLNAGFLWMGLQNQRSSKGALTPENLSMIAKTVRKTCDAKDGLKDGIVADPRACKLPPEFFSCRKNNTKGCLNPEQVKTLALMRQGPRNPHTGAQIYPPFTQGSEAGWGYLFKDDKPYRAAFWTDWVFDNPDWSTKSFDWDRDIARMDDKLAPVINAIDPDLSQFRARGGKLILYQGWSDPVVSALDTIKYYDDVTKAMGGPAKTQSFARLFMVPDMGHCGTFGGGDFDLMRPDSGSGLDAITLLDRWVTDAVPPERLVVEERKHAQRLRTRAACPYPAVAVWNRKGNPDDERSFICRPPGRNPPR